MAFQSPIKQGLQYYPITLVLMVICIGVFAVQLIFGVNGAHPTSQSLLTWGANFLPYSLGDAPWRLVTSLFLHIGIMHLMFNMFALYYFGQVAERMFGSRNFLLLFLLSGIGGSLLNNYWALHAVMAGEPPIISAGASGGIMGIGMALLVAALTKTSFNQIALNFRSLLMVMAINLGYGFFVGGIDNASHVGGAVIGGLLGIVYVMQHRVNGQQQFLINETNQAHWHSDMQTTGQLPGTASVLSSQPLMGKIIVSSYILLTLVFVLIYGWLHHRFMQLFVNAVPSFIN